MCSAPGQQDSLSSQKNYISLSVQTFEMSKLLVLCSVKGAACVTKFIKIQRMGAATKLSGKRPWHFLAPSLPPPPLRTVDRLIDCCCFFFSVHMYTYQQEFICHYSRLSSVLDMDTVISQQSLREVAHNLSVKLSCKGSLKILRHSLLICY